MSSYNASFAKKEINTISLKNSAFLRVALVYPNRYYLGMSNLGVHTIYYQLNKRADTLCERFFYDPTRKHLLSVESRSSLKSYDIIAFSVSYELDYIYCLNILKQSGLLNKARKRTVMPLIILGGIVTSFNPYAFSNFSDAIFIGEAEESLNEFMDLLTQQQRFNTLSKKDNFLKKACHIPGLFVPEFSSQEVEVRTLENVDLYPTSSRILTVHTEFPHTFLTEVSRGCPWRCKFCATGNVFKNFRPRKLNILQNEINEGMKYTSKIGLVGAAISDYPQIEGLIDFLKEKKAKISISSLRVETVKPILLDALAESGQRTITFAPEAGSERLRNYLNKKTTDEQLLDKVILAQKAGIKKIKLYFMVGLPTEEFEDIEAIVKLVSRIVKILPVKVLVGIFIPKPKTPFANSEFLSKKVLTERIKFIRHNLAGCKNLEFAARNIKEALQESLFACAGADFLESYC